jgi:transketolase C-terminal domain/subunit
MSDPVLPDDSVTMMARERPWLSVLTGFFGFWVLFGVNFVAVGVFTETSVGVIAGLATLGQIIVIVNISLTEILAAIATRMGITRRTSNG